MAGRRPAIIAVLALEVSPVAACGGEAADRIDAIPTIVATAPATTQPRPAASVIVADATTQLRTVAEEAVGASASIPGLVVHIAAPQRRLDVSVAAGVADRATATPLTPDAGFRIASNTKTFTAAAILRLVEQGQLQLDAPIGDVLAPETVDALRAGGYRPEAITVRHVLVHTSGIYDVGQDPAYQAAVNADPVKRWTRLEQVRFAMNHGAPIGEPGTVYAYSDTGYGLLGEIIERVTAAPLAEAYRTLLDFERLQLDATYLESREPVPPGSAGRAHQYVGDIDGFDADPSFDPVGAAGLVSTVHDLSRFYRALLGGKVFDLPGTLATMLEVPTSNTETGAAMGIFRIDISGNECWQHSGFWGTFVATCPQIDVTIAASWSQATPDLDFDGERIVTRAFELATAP